MLAPSPSPQTHKTFIAAVQSVFFTSASRPWASSAQFIEHKSVALQEASSRYAAVGCLFLAERCLREQQNLLRGTGRLDHMHAEFHRMVNVFKTTIEAETIATSQGAFYWVQFVGKGE